MYARRVHTDERRRALNEQIERGVLESERLRQTILSFVLVCTIPVVYTTLNSGRHLSKNVDSRIFDGLILATVLASSVTVVYSWTTRYVIGRMLATGRRMPRIARFFNSLVEAMLVTWFVLAFAYVVDPVFAYTAPPSYTYFVFIMFTILQLDFALSIFMGVICALLFVGTGLYTFAGVREIPGEKLLTSPIPILAKGVLFVLGGIVAGFVARELRHRTVHAIESMDEKNRAIEMFGKHVSPKVADALLKSGGEFAGEQKFICVMFLDIRNFTSFSERTAPKDVVAFLDTLFEPLVEIVNRHGGIVNKFLGDGFMAVFGAPVSEGQPCRDAISAAIDIVAEVDKMVADKKIPPTNVGIGLHAGEAITGTIGAQSRKEYTVIGDTVNLASRIEQLTKKFGAKILVSDAVWDNAGKLDVAAEALEKTEVKGREAPVQVYKIG